MWSLIFSGVTSFVSTYINYIKVVLAVVTLCLVGYLGYSVGYSKLVNYKLEQEKVTRQVEKQQQEATDQIRKEKDAQITSINNQLLDAISELHKRPRRTDKTSNGQSGTGAALFSEDAIFLRREAARADEIRAGLDACYKQYDDIK